MHYCRLCNITAASEQTYLDHVHRGTVLPQQSVPAAEPRGSRCSLCPGGQGSPRPAGPDSAGWHSPPCSPRYCSAPGRRLGGSRCPRVLGGVGSTGRAHGQHRAATRRAPHAASPRPGPAEPLPPATPNNPGATTALGERGGLNRAGRRMGEVSLSLPPEVAPAAHGEAARRCPPAPSPLLTVCPAGAPE